MVTCLAELRKLLILKIDAVLDFAVFTQTRRKLMRTEDKLLQRVFCALRAKLSGFRSLKSGLPRRTAVISVVDRDFRVAH